MIRNSHTRKQTPVPKPPYNPMIESIDIGYSAEEEYFSMAIPQEIDAVSIISIH